jgi:hypothetical protein
VDARAWKHFFGKRCRCGGGHQRLRAIVARLSCSWVYGHRRERPYPRYHEVSAAVPCKRHLCDTVINLHLSSVYCLLFACTRLRSSAVPMEMLSCPAECSACFPIIATMLHRGSVNAGTCYSLRFHASSVCLMFICSCKLEENSQSGRGICGDSESTSALQGESTESDRCQSIGILHQPVEHPIILVATRNFDVPHDGRVCAVISGSSSFDGASRWCTESPSQVINLRGILPGSWAVRIETVDWCAGDVFCVHLGILESDSRAGQTMHRRRRCRSP